MKKYKSILMSIIFLGILLNYIAWIMLGRTNSIESALSELRGAIGAGSSIIALGIVFYALSKTKD